MGVIESVDDKSKSLNMRYDNEEMKNKAYQICREFLSGSWKKITADQMIFKSVTGGLSNILFFCSLPSTHAPIKGEPNQVLLRMYGQMHIGGEVMPQTAVTDAVVFMLLSERKLGPKLYGIFPGGRLEEYLSARAMSCTELHDPVFSRVIARKLANVHSLNVPINKEPCWLFDTMNNWLNVVRSTISLDEVKAEHQVYATYLLKFNFEKELEWLKDFLSEAKSPVVFCHNDLQEGNILLPDGKITDRLANNNLNITNGHSMDNVNLLIDKDNENDDIYNLTNFNTNDNDNNKANEINFDTLEGKANEINRMRELDERIVLIDFEYCSYNYRGFDLGNHFCEWALDYTNTEYPHFTANEQNYPSEKERRAFIREYLQRAKALDHNNPIHSEDHLLIEADHYTLASHMLWALWSIMNAFTSPIQFGYWEYAKVRLDFYLSWKKQQLQKRNL